MNIQVLKSKIHRATVTEADLNYIGSIAIDEDLMDAANLIENEKVSIYNITKGKRKSGVISLNGAAARKVAVNDLVIIVSYASIEFEKAKTFKPAILFPDENNRLK